ncbi:cation diffusion facilitator family transporter [Chelatococcus reniformis]|nr:cation diffusion facilitator family transporter [Chelatococcus reniformis]
MTSTERADVEDGSGNEHGRWLAAVLALTAASFVLQIAGAWAGGSLALGAGAAHMFADAAALAVALAALRSGCQPPDDPRAFVYRRFQLLTAGCNVVLLVAAMACIIGFGALRLLGQPFVDPTALVLAGSLALLVDLARTGLLAERRGFRAGALAAARDGWHEGLDSLAIIVAGVLIWLSGWAWIDTVVAAGLAVRLLPRAWALAGDATRVLLNGVPYGPTLAEIRAELRGVDGIADIHDLHLWATDQQETQASVHLALVDAAELESIRVAVIRIVNDFGIKHVTVQLGRPAVTARARR